MSTGGEESAEACNKKPISRLSDTGKYRMRFESLDHREQTAAGSESFEAAGAQPGGIGIFSGVISLERRMDLKVTFGSFLFHRTAADAVC